MKPPTKTEGARKERFEPIHPKTTFDDVAEMYEVKKKLEETVIWPLEYPELYEKFVGKMSKGILLYGPPGCGKTYIGRSLAGEASKQAGKNISFIYAKAGDILGSWVGNSEKNLGAVFETAVEKEPCIIFFDELDVIGGARRGRSAYVDQLISEFLADFDIVKDKQVILIGATNRPWTVDPALTKVRFGTKIFVGPPDSAARTELYELHSRGLKVSNNVDFVELAGLTELYTASDIEAICDKAAKLAKKEVRTNPNRHIEQRDHVAAIAKVGSTIDDWYLKEKKNLHDPDIRATYPGLGELVEKIKGRRVA